MKTLDAYLKKNLNYLNDNSQQLYIRSKIFYVTRDAFCFTFHVLYTVYSWLTWRDFAIFTRINFQIHSIMFVIKYG